jgi:hypothetical protein
MIAQQHGFFHIGGTLPADAPSYIPRHADDQLLAALREGEFCSILDSRQIGKSTLITRAASLLREEGVRVAKLDLSLYGQASATPEAWYFTLLEDLVSELGLEEQLTDFWHRQRETTPSYRWMEAVCQVALPECDTPLVIFLDEIDFVRSLPFSTDEFFASIRALYNRRMSHQDESLSRLTFAIAHSTEPHLFITNQAVSPFNVGVRMALADFTPAEAAELNRRYGAPLQTSQEADRLYALLGGHPYLTSRALYEMGEHGLPPDELEAQAEQEGGPFGDHLRRLLSLLTQDPTLTEAMIGILHGMAAPDAPVFYRLRSAGIVAGETERDARPRCRLYADYLRRHLIV